MKVISLGLGILLAAGLAVAAYMLSASPPAQVEAPGVDPAIYFDQTADVEQRILALEAAVAEERNARQLLEEELSALYAEIDALGEADREQDLPVEPDAAELQRRARAALVQRSRMDDSTEGRLRRLTEAGFAPDRADWIIKREAELQLAAMQATFEARRAREPLDFLDPRVNPDAALRAEIGDAEYEQYLTADGRSTTVSVGMVIDSSPGQIAGLRPGDEIVRYNGQRVFNTMELNLQTMQGEPGESVVVDVLRDGVPVQFVLPRGPIGITTQGFRRRR